MQCADPPAPVPDPSNLAGWFFGGVLLLVLIFEVWANRTQHPTISQWMRRVFRRHRWWGSFAASLIGLTLWHLFFGGPL